MKALAFAALSMLALTGCQQSLREEVTPQALAEEAQKLVVTGFVSPQDSVISVKVSRSRTLLDAGAGSNAVATANVTLAGPNGTVGLAFNARLQTYQVDARKFPIVAGNTYTLTVQTTDGQSAKSTCTVPQAVALNRVQLDSTVAADGSRAYFARYDWQGRAEATAFYQTQGTFQYVKKCATCREEATAAQKVETAPVSFGASTQLSGWVADEARAGALSAKGNLAASDPKASFQSSYSRAAVQATLLHVEETYFRYHQAVERATAQQANPFSEPVIIPSNIQGGLGCFAAYNKAVVTVQLKK
jgi:thiol:disulfide interchange protein